MYYDYYLYYLSYFTSVYNGYPLVIRVTAIMVTILSLITVIGLIRLVVVGFSISRREKRKKEVQKQFEEKLFFAMGNAVNYSVDDIKSLFDEDVSVSKKWKLDMLTDIVLSVKHQVYTQGNFNEINYKNCLDALRLMGFWENRIRSSSSLVQRRKAIQIIGKMDNGVNTGLLSTSTFHKNKHLRKTARDLYTGQDVFNPFKFMEENFDESFTQLDKLRLHSTLVKRSREGKLPNLLRWLTDSKNPNYIIFVLKEISYFKQIDAAPSLLPLLDKQENRDVRAQIVLTLGDLGYHEAIPFFKRQFFIESGIVREAIITALGKIKKVEVLDFLISIYEETDNAELQLLIARSIKNFEEDGARILIQLQNVARVNHKQIEDVLLEQVMTENSISTI